MPAIRLDNGDKIFVSKKTGQELSKALESWKGELFFFSNDEVSVRISEIVYVK
jgi:hypothetical protein